MSNPVNCLVPVRANLASKARSQMKACGKTARLRVKWPLRRVGRRVEIVEVMACGQHAAANATTKFIENVPADCYTTDEIKLLAEHGMYVKGHNVRGMIGRIKAAGKKLKKLGRAA